MIVEELKEELSRIAIHPVQWNCRLAPFTSFGIGGPADAMITVESTDELAELFNCFAKNRLQYRFIGKGTNLLVSDKGFEGVVLLFAKALSTIRLLEEVKTGEGRIRVGAGCSLARLLHWCTENEYTGLEFVSGIPGSLGGAVVMNAGAWDGEIADVITSLTVFSKSHGEERLDRSDLDFVYRKWKNQKNKENEERLVLSADIILHKGTKTSIATTCREYLKKRKEKQPKGVKNAGSFFKNPPEDSAGRLIEAAGLKGKRFGDAMVSPVHANFLVNMGTATASDVKMLMECVINRVKKESGIELQAEVHFL